MVLAQNFLIPILYLMKYIRNNKLETRLTTAIKPRFHYQCQPWITTVV